MHLTRALLTLTHCAQMLLYLNEDTFKNEIGARLAVEVRAAMRLGLTIVMAHENDSDRGGCIFGYFFQTTPEDLINVGLYKKIATAFHQEPLRPISHVMLAKEIGAVKLEGGVSGMRRSISRRLTSRNRESRADEATEARRSLGSRPSTSVISATSATFCSEMPPALHEDQIQQSEATAARRSQGSRPSTSATVSSEMPPSVADDQIQQSGRSDGSERESVYEAQYADLEREMTNALGEDD